MNTQLSVAAIVTAGFTPKEDDPLAEYTQGGSKALIPIAGKPMIAHVVDALAGSRYVKHIAIVALDPAADVRFSVPVEYVSDAGSLTGNVEAGINYVIEHYPDVDAAILSSSDVPIITSAIVDAFIEACLHTDHDIYYSIVERSVMETRFPGSRRSYVHMKDGDFAGGDLIFFRRTSNLGDQELWRRLSSSRKNALRQVAMIGLWPLIKLLTRRLTIAEGEERACRALGIRGHAVSCPHAEVGMDVDKPFQLEIARAELEARAANKPQG